MKRAVSPLFAVIMVVLVLIIAGLLWYIFSVPKQEQPGARGPGIGLSVPKPGAAIPPVVKEKAAEAKAKLEAGAKAKEKGAAPAKAGQ
jgi:hypothetical protein